MTTTMVLTCFTPERLYFSDFLQGFSQQTEKIPLEITLTRYTAHTRTRTRVYLPEHVQKDSPHDEYF